MKKIWHPWHEWECFKAGFYDTTCQLHPEVARGKYREFLADLPRFRHALQRVLREWPKSCEHFLSNESINRIAWLGQASMCIDTGIPSVYRGGFKMLSAPQQDAANAEAALALEAWINGINGTADSYLCEDVEREGLPGGHTGCSTNAPNAARYRAIVQSDMFCDPE